MRKNDGIPAGQGGQDGPDEDKWNVPLNEAFVQAASIREPAARPGPGKRVGPRRFGPGPQLALALLAAAAVVALKITLSSSPSGNDATAAPSASPSPTSSASPAAGAAARPMVPLADAFPAQVPDGSGGTFTRVGSVVLQTCTEADSVGPRLIAMIKESKGCVGEQIALYKDARNNQYNLAVFTMKDPQDTLRLVTELAMAFDDYQVGAQAPPRGSGLPTLAPDSGMVQSFTGEGRAMVVALGQWSDGRVADYRQLVDLMQPLQRAVSDKVGRYENAR
ncbi:hypothetical protein [Streptomyces sp. NPDC001717]|uniref:hypothetical protein n=1 Tax=Streptomyces sp. NPDC001717 TaxID=3364604 RepID=UPI0036C9EF7B